MNKTFLSLCCAMVATSVAAQSLPDGATTSTPVDRENPVAVWLHSIQPASPHQALAERTGTWHVTYRAWFKPDQAPTDVYGLAERSMILDGRVLEEKLTLPLPGREYSGVTHLGYNNVTEQYWWQRLDNMSTWITRSSLSDRSEDGEITFEILVLDHANGTENSARVVLRTEPDREVYEWYQPDAMGEVFKSIEYTYTRSAATDEPSAEDDGTEAEAQPTTDVSPGR